MFNNQAGSRRWTHFHSALQLAIQRSAHKWTYEDFAECFPLYAEEDKNGSSATFNSISDYIEAQNFRDLDKLFREYSVQDNIDILHKVINEAKDRKARGETGKNIWSEDLQPRIMVCARTVPTLENEAEQLRKSLATMTAENDRIQAELETIIQATDTTNQKSLELLETLDTGWTRWEELPFSEVEEWTVQTLETLKPQLRS